MFVMSKIHDLKLKSRFYPDKYTRQVNLEIDVIRKQLLAFCLHTMPCDDFAAEESARQYPRFDGSKWIAPSDQSDQSDQSDRSGQLVLRSFSEGGSTKSTGGSHAGQD